MLSGIILFFSQECLTQLVYRRWPPTTGPRLTGTSAFLAHGSPPPKAATQDKHLIWNAMTMRGANPFKKKKQAITTGWCAREDRGDTAGMGDRADENGITDLPFTGVTCRDASASKKKWCHCWWDQFKKRSTMTNFPFSLYFKKPFRILLGPKKHVLLGPVPHGKTFNVV